MKNKINKIISVICLVTICLIASIKYLDIIKADSGWDSSYDSGGSWDSGYDYDYDDADYSSSGGHASYSKICTPEMVFSLFSILLMMICYTILIKMLKALMPRKINNHIDKNKYPELTQLQVSAIIPGFDVIEFNFRAYQIFYDIQIAWMNFDYDKLKELITDELYNSYVMQLEALKLNNHKNTMKEFELIESHIFELKEENGLYIAKVYLEARFYDYVESIKNEMIIRGSDYKKLLIHTFLHLYVQKKNLII